MANPPRKNLAFTGSCPDCGRREAKPPSALPAIGDDFDWLARDFDSFRSFMLQELQAQFPQRERWTSADLEVVLIEAFAAVLDQLSDMADRVASEAYLETARRPQSVRRLLKMIGYDPVMERIKDEWQQSGHLQLWYRQEARRLEQDWLERPEEMELARRRGPAKIRTQRRMVTIDDYARRLEDHPLVARADSKEQWTGSWTTVRIAVVLWDQTLDLDKPIDSSNSVPDKVGAFHRHHGIGLPNPQSTVRRVLRDYLEMFRMAGQEVVLQDAVPVGIIMSLSVEVAPNYFRSEIRSAVGEVLGQGPKGFFAPGRLHFGEDILVGEVIQALMSLSGIDNVCVRSVKRVGSLFDDVAYTPEGRIVLKETELAVCDNDPTRPERGYYRLTLHGGLRG